MSDSEKGKSKRVCDRFKEECSVERSWAIFSKDSSFFALKHILNKDLHWFERLFWAAIIFIGALLCGCGIFFSGKKLTGSMIQIDPNDEPSPIWTVPFPAVTICGREGEIGKTKPLKWFCEQACWGHRCACCEAFFSQTHTEIGVCYTFNNIAAAELFNRDEMLSELVLSNATKKIENWDMQAGYEDIDASRTYYPRRAMDLTPDYELKLIFKINSPRGNDSTISVDIHNPVDFPFRAKNLILAESGQLLKIAVQPNVKTGRRYLKFSTPQSTNCYYGDQHQLQFFNLYSQQNCELECRTKYVLETRNCVYPHMPRPAGVPYCNESLSITEEVILKEITPIARRDNIPPSKYFVKTCNCLPSCNEIRYKATASKEETLNETSNSEMIIRFDKDHFYGSKITIRYGIIDFLATAGGLLSLFLSVSFITIVEILYYCTLKPFFLK